MKEILSKIINSQIYETDIRLAYSLLNSYVLSNTINMDEDPKLKSLHRTLDIYAGLTESRTPDAAESAEIKSQIESYLFFLNSNN